jgi:hypothetical protein
MDPQPTFGIKELLTHVVADIAKAVGERSGESRQCNYDRTEAAARSIMAFQPRDVIEVMLAGNCMMFHEMIVDSVQATLRGEETATRRAARGNIVAMDKAFGNNLALLESYRTRQAAATPADAQTEVEIAERVRRHQSQADTRDATDPIQPTYTVEPAQSRETGLAAAQLAGLNRQARRAFDRQARKRIVPATAHTANSAVRPAHTEPATTVSATTAG